MEVLELDLSNVDAPDSLHSLLASRFAFPDYYGGNWDAFDECARDVSLPDVISVTGLARLSRVLPREAWLLRACLRDLEKEGRITCRWSEEPA